MKLDGATVGRPIVRAHSDFYFRDWERREGLRSREMDVGTSGDWRLIRNKLMIFFFFLMMTDNIRRSFPSFERKWEIWRFRDRD